MPLAMVARRWRIHLCAAVAGAIGAFAVVPGHTPGQVVGGQLPTIMAVRGGVSNNWAGYMVGALDRPNAGFRQVSADWTVPAARARAPQQAGYSATWIGIGGGCIDRGCSLTDGTLIQAGTEQDVTAAGAAAYSAWYELVPGPTTPLPAVDVRPGDRMHADLHETSPGSESWSVTVSDLSSRTTQTVTVQYPSSSLTAEWVEETPLLEDSNGAMSVGSLPDLAPVDFTGVRLDGAPAQLGNGSVRLVDLGGAALAVPSAAGPGGDSFRVCPGAVASCAVPAR